MSDQPTKHTYSGDVANVETRHEESDVNVRALIWFMVVFIIFAAVTHFGLYLLYRFYRNMERGAAANAPISSVAMPRGADVPPAPHLQPFPNRMPNNEVMPPTHSTPVVDMAEMRESENRRLASYGWVDKQHGVVHIPIEEAKKLALQSGAYQVNPATTDNRQPTTTTTP
ncbi:MAG TPA: hypothetical protein VF381_12540 [Thermoanaerobaculia bacterium]